MLTDSESDDVTLADDRAAAGLTPVKKEIDLAEPWAKDEPRDELEPPPGQASPVTPVVSPFAPGSQMGGHHHGQGLEAATVEDEWYEGLLPSGGELQDLAELEAPVARLLDLPDVAVVKDEPRPTRPHPIF